MTVSPSPAWKMESGTRDLVTSPCLGGIERAIGAREKCIRRLVGLSRADTSRNRHLHAGRERAPVEFGNDLAEPFENLCGLVGCSVGQNQQEFLTAIATEPVDASDVGE